MMMIETFSPATKTYKILIIEDEGDICFLLSTILKQEYFEIDTVQTLAQAHVFLKEETPDLVFLDNNLPDGFGMDLIEPMRKQYPDIKIVMITGNNVNIAKKGAILKGADIFLPKPFSSAQIYDAVEQLIHCRIKH